MPKKIFTKLVKVTQKIMITIFLILIYFLGFGITFLLVAIFNRKLIYGNLKNKDSSWLKAEGYDPDLQGSLRQS
jgi:cytochrome c biogenesis protein CcdA